MTDIPRDNDEELLALFDDVNDQSFLYFRKRVGEFLEAREREAEKRVIEWLETDLKRLDSRNWSMNTLALDTLVGSGKADEYQKMKRQQIVVDRRAAHALYAILNSYKKHPKPQGDKQ